MAHISSLLCPLDTLSNVSYLISWNFGAWVNPISMKAMHVVLPSRLHASKANLALLWVNWLLSALKLGYLLSQE